MPDSWDFDSHKKTIRNRNEFVPVVTFVSIALSVLLTASTFLDTPGGSDFWRNLNAAALPNSTRIWDGSYQLFITSMFIHGSLFHILFNMIWFYRFGMLLEEKFDSIKFGLMILGLAFISGAGELAISGHTGIGMSGVVYGMFGLLYSMRDKYPEFRKEATRYNLNLFLIWGAFCFIATWTGSGNFGNYAHSTGLLAGLGFGWIFARPKYKWMGIAILVSLVLLSGFAVTYMPWNGYWCAWKGEKEIRLKHNDAGEYWIGRSMKLLKISPNGAEESNNSNLPSETHKPGINNTE